MRRRTTTAMLVLAVIGAGAACTPPPPAAVARYVQVTTAGVNTHPSVSDDGRIVAYTNQGFPGVATQIVVADRSTHTTRQLTSDAGLSSYDAIVSGDGTAVLYSTASPVPDATGSDLFIRDLVTDTVQFVPAPAGSAYGRSISADGKVVAYSTYSDSTFSIIRWDRTTSPLTATLIAHSPAGGGTGGGVTMSPNGRFVAFLASWAPFAGAPAGTNLYRYDTQTATFSVIGPVTSLLAVAAVDDVGDVVHSANGVDTMFWHADTATSSLIAAGVAGSEARLPTAITADGRRVIVGHADVSGGLLFGALDQLDLVDTATRATTVLADATRGKTGAGDASRNGRYVTFESAGAYAGTDPNPGSGSIDVFLWDRGS